VSCTSTTGCGDTPLSVVEVVISRFIQYVDEVETHAGSAVVLPGSRVESWTVLGNDDVPVEPIDRWLGYLSGPRAPAITGSPPPASPTPCSSPPRETVPHPQHVAGMSEITDPQPLPGSRLRTASRAYQAAIDDLARGAHLAA
jgi:hypothetical protein